MTKPSEVIKAYARRKLRPDSTPDCTCGDCAVRRVGTGTRPDVLRAEINALYAYLDACAASIGSQSSEPSVFQKGAYLLDLPAYHEALQRDAFRRERQQTPIAADEDE